MDCIHQIGAKARRCGQGRGLWNSWVEGGELAFRSGRELPPSTQPTTILHFEDGRAAATPVGEKLLPPNIEKSDSALENPARSAPVEVDFT